MLWVFMLSVPIFGTLARIRPFPSIDYSKLKIPESRFLGVFKDKRILSLTDDPAVFQDNRSASYFLDWRLSKEVFDNPEYFENVILVSNSFEKDLPEIIIDPDDKMKKFFERLPQYKNRYQ